MTILTLNDQTFWRQTLAVLRQPVDCLVMPQFRLPCPICHEELFSISRTSCGGWGHCRKCGFRGTALELAAAVWRLTLPVTWRKLRTAQMPAVTNKSFADFNAFRQTVIEPQDRWAEFWPRARVFARLHSSSELRALQHRWHINPTRSEYEHWEDGIGECIGAGTADDVITAASSRYSAPRASRLFHGRKWQHIMLFPLFDATTHVCGYYCLGTPDTRDDGVLLPVYSDKRLRLSSPSGVALLPLLDSARSERYDNTRFVVTDIPIATYLQVRQMQTQAESLPLVGWDATSDASLDCVWANSSPRRTIFWCPRGLSPAILREAQRVDGLIAIPPAAVRSIDEYILRWPPHVLLRAVLENAKPWEEMLDYVLTSQPEHAEDFLTKMQLPAAVLAQLQVGGSDVVRDAVSNLCDLQHLVLREIQLGAETIEETHNGWQLQRTQEIICDAILRISRITYHVPTQQQTLSGEIQYQNHTIPFQASHKELERRGVAAWLNSKLLACGLGPLDYAPSWASRLMRVAQQFCHPAVTSVRTGVGWDDTASFRFPEFAIGADRQILFDTLPMLPHMPCTTFTPPDIVSPQLIAWLSQDTDAVRGVWAVVLALLTTILPTRELWLTALISDTYDSKLLLKQLGCPELEWPNDSDALDTYLDFHRWPAVLTVKRADSPELQAWLAEQPRRLLTVVNDLCADAMRVNLPHVQYVAAREFELHPDLEQLLPAILQFCSQQNWQCMQKTLDGSVAAIAALLVDWMQQNGGDGRNIVAADVQRPTDTAERISSFVRVVCRLYQRGYLVAANADFMTNSHGLPAILQTASGDIRIPLAGVNQGLTRCRAPLLNVAAIVPLLKQQSVVRASQLRADRHPAVTVDGAWWNLQVAEAQQAIQ